MKRISRYLPLTTNPRRSAFYSRTSLNSTIQIAQNSTSALTKKNVSCISTTTKTTTTGRLVAPVMPTTLQGERKGFNKSVVWSFGKPVQLHRAFHTTPRVLARHSSGFSQAVKPNLLIPPPPLYDYEGDLNSEGLPDGFGKGVWRDQNGVIIQEYTGDWSQGHLQGWGVLQSSNDRGDYAKYEGEWINSMRHGVGTYSSSQDGVTTVLRALWNLNEGYFILMEQQRYGKSFSYEGGYSPQGPIGFGIEKQPGSIFQGEYKKGGRNGFGKLFDEDGSLRVAGEWKDDKLDGFAVRYVNTPSGPTEYSGFWKQDAPDGYMNINVSGNAVYSGLYTANGIDRFGKTSPTLTGITYEGEFEGGQAHGFGQGDYENNQQYIGQYARGQWNGYGLYRALKDTSDGSCTIELQVYATWNDGVANGIAHRREGDEVLFWGDMVDDKYHGYGVLASRDGLYEGQFSNGSISGWGQLTRPDGTVLRCMWHNSNAVFTTRNGMPVLTEEVETTAAMAAVRARTKQKEAERLVEIITKTISEGRAKVGRMKRERDAVIAQGQATFAEGMKRFDEMKEVHDKTKAHIQEILGHLAKGLAKIQQVDSPAWGPMTAGEIYNHLFLFSRKPEFKAARIEVQGSDNPFAGIRIFSNFASRSNLTIPLASNPGLVDIKIEGHGSDIFTYHYLFFDTFNKQSSRDIPPIWLPEVIKQHLPKQTREYPGYPQLVHFIAEVLRQQTNEANKTALVNKLAAVLYPTHPDFIDDLNAQILAPNHPESPFDIELNDGDDVNIIWARFSASGDERCIQHLLPHLVSFYRFKNWLLYNEDTVLQYLPTIAGVGYDAWWSLTSNAYQHSRVLSILKTMLRMRPQDLLPQLSKGDRTIVFSVVKDIIASVEQHKARNGEFPDEAAAAQNLVRLMYGALQCAHNE